MDKNKSMRIAALATGALAMGSITTLQAESLFEANDLGSGAELRSDLIQKNNPLLGAVKIEANGTIELKCGEGTCGEKKEESKKGEKAEGKAGEHKCGEGSCGEKKEEGKKAEKAEGKSGEHKCGEGSCGESKTGEGSCGL